MRILLAYDQSPPSDVAAMYLLRLPFEQPVDLEIVSVVQPFPFSENQAERMSPRVVELLDQERVQAEAKLADVVAHFQDDTFRSVRGKVIDGGPAYALLDYAEDHQTDLIVMGAVGKSAIKRVALGSVSDSVANRASCSVLVVRSQSPSQASVEFDPAPKQVLLAFEDSGRDVEVANSLRNFKWPKSTRIQVVHVSQLISLYGKDIVQQSSDLWQQSKAETESRAALLAEKIRDWGYETCSSVVAGPHIGEALLSYAGEHECDLIVTGDRRHGVVKRLFLGSVSRHLLRHADCNVLISRE